MGAFASILASIAAGETSAIMKRAKRNAIVYAFAGFAILLAILFLLVALYVWAAFRYGPIWAALGFAAFFFVVAIVAVLINKVAASSQKKQEARRRAVDTKAIATTAALTILPALLTRKGSALAVLAPVAGVIGYLVYRENSRGISPDINPRPPRRRPRA